MVCCSKWWRTSQAPAAVGSPSSFDINTFHNCAPTKRYRRKQLESFKWLWVLAMCQREYFLEYYLAVNVLRNISTVLLRNISTDCGTNLWAIYERGLGNSGLGRRLCPPRDQVGEQCVSRETPFLLLLSLQIMRVFMHLLIIKALFASFFLIHLDIQYQLRYCWSFQGFVTSFKSTCYVPPNYSQNHLLYAAQLFVSCVPIGFHPRPPQPLVSRGAEVS